MPPSDPFRAVLVADLALVLDLVTARDVAAAVERYWSERERVEADLGEELKRVAGLSVGDLRRIEGEVDRLVAQAGGSSSQVVAERGGIDASIHEALSGSRISRDLTEMGAGPRPCLRSLPEGRYESFEPIGVGGMGLVFRAHDRELQREVAFKVVRPETVEADRGSPFGISPPSGDDPLGREFSRRAERFLLEARVTGRLQHPGILPVYEMGRTPDGLPYYTMRYVPGHRTLADALAEAMSREDRLGLLDPFLTLCDTVRYAHSRGVLHRDLKPANVALGEYGEVAVLDWGLARTNGHDDPSPEGESSAGNGGGLTSVARALGTPGYMSPEALAGECVDERGDVYGLGSTLFEILTGRLPFRFGDLPELRARLPNEDPPLVTEVDPGLPDGLARICARALARRRRDRIPDVGALATALRAWREQSAIERETDLLMARAEAAREAAEGLRGPALMVRLDRAIALATRVQELRPGHAEAAELIAGCKRDREGAIAGRQRRERRSLLQRVAAAGLLVAFVALAGFAWLLGGRRDEAEVAKARAEELQSFLLFKLYRPMQRAGRLDLLGPVARAVLESYQGVPAEDLDEEAWEGWSVAHAQTGDVLRAQDDLDGALVAYRAALEIRVRHLSAGRASGDPLWSPRHLHGRVASVLVEMARYGEAHAEWGRSLDLCDALLEEDPGNPALLMDRAWSRLGIAGVLAARGKSTEALECRQAAIDEMAEVTRVHDRARWRSMLATALRCQGVAVAFDGDMTRAIDLLEAAVETCRELVESDPGDAKLSKEHAECLGGLGEALLAEGGRPVDARSPLGAALEIFRRLGDLDPANVRLRRSVADCHSMLGEALWRSGDREAALRHHDAALEIGLRFSGRAARPRWLWSTQKRFGLSNREKGDLDAALPYFRDAVETCRQAVEVRPDSPPLRVNLAQMRMTHGDLLLALGEVGSVRTEIDRALRILDTLIRDDGRPLSPHVLRACGLVDLGDLHAHARDWPSAGQRYEEAFESLKPWIDRGFDRSDLVAVAANALARLGDAVSRQGCYEEADQHFAAAIGKYERLVEREPGVAYHRSLAYGWSLRGNHEARQGLMKEAAATYCEKVIPVHVKVLALAPHLQGEHDDYVNEYRRFLLLAELRSPETPWEHLVLAGYQYELGRFAEAAENYDRGLPCPGLENWTRNTAYKFAARACSRASEKATGDRRAEHRQEALAWLAKLLEAIREWDAETERDFRSGRMTSEEHARALRYTRDDLEYLRDNDKTLDAIRDDPAFRALFEE